MTEGTETGSPPSERIVALYERYAHEWDAARGRSLFERAWLDRFAALLRPGASVLDMGCGGGEPIARHLIERGFRLTGVDSSPTLISLCRARFPGHRWVIADMRTLALADAFDGIIAWDSFFHLSHQDQRRVVPIFAAHASATAALLFTSGPQHGEAIGEYRGEALYHASLSAPQYRALLAADGFAVIRHVAEDPDCGDHTVWLAHRRQAMAR